MASLALPSRVWSLAAPLAAPLALRWALPLPLLELLPAILRAVPKSKTSHSRKAMRSANKGLKDKQNIVNCPACGHAKLAHHLCPHCYSTLSRAWKAMSKRQGDIPDLA